MLICLNLVLIFQPFKLSYMCILCVFWLYFAGFKSELQTGI